MADDRILLRMCRMSGHEMKFITEAFEGEWVVPLGPNVSGFEKDLEKFLGEGRRVVALSSGTAALHLGLLMLGVGEGDEVMVQTMTFSASVNPVRYVGAVPVMVDSEPSTWNIDPDLLDKAIADRVEATGRKP
ncbi:MAG: aminotransferase class I/II-fold pyridoxal phosphate-dependent enzyme, partial [Muribaculaceae bacterium]|nr:aminotransferase class I/II-fold pyridoxal phosphate-dependent enzyme [Muribaculaceae bacterium]